MIAIAARFALVLLLAIVLAAGLGLAFGPLNASAAISKPGLDSSQCSYQQKLQPYPQQACQSYVPGTSLRG